MESGTAICTGAVSPVLLSGVDRNKRVSHLFFDLKMTEFETTDMFEVDSENCKPNSAHKLSLSLVSQVTPLNCKRSRIWHNPVHRVVLAEFNY